MRTFVGIDNIVLLVGKDMQGVFDIGGTGYRVAMADSNKQLLNMGFGETCNNYQQGILNLIKSLYESGANQGVTKIAGAIAGKVDKNTNLLTFSPNLVDWVGKPLKFDLEKEFGCEVILENDAVAEGLGEAIAGAGKGFFKIGYFCAGTGIGGAMIQMVDSRWQMADLEPGWTYKVGDKYLEEVAGGKALGDIRQVDWKKEAELLALGINNTFKLLSPEIIVLGGSLFKSIDLEYLQQLVLGKIVRGSLGQEAGLWGCLNLVS